MNPTTNPEEFSHYYFIIDGEVVWRESIAKNSEMEMVNAIFSSDPKIVKGPEELGITIKNGWAYDGTTFSPPA